MKKMNSFQSFCWNTSSELLNKSWNEKFANQIPSIIDVFILPSVIGIICLTGFVGNIIIVLTIIRYGLFSFPLFMESHAKLQKINPLSYRILLDEVMFGKYQSKIITEYSIVVLLCIEFHGKI